METAESEADDDFRSLTETVDEDEHTTRRKSLSSSPKIVDNVNPDEDPGQREPDHSRETYHNETLVNDLQTQNRELLAINGRCEQDIRQMQTELDAQKIFIETTVTQAQTAAFALISRTVSTSLPDDKIRLHWSDVFREMAFWARKSARQQNEEVSTLEVQESMESHGLVRNFSKESDTIPFDFNYNESTSFSTLLNAAIARSMCENYLENPFFFLRAASRSTLEDVHKYDMLQKDLNWLYQSLLTEKNSGDPSSIHRWRASTVRLLKSGLSPDLLSQMYEEDADNILNQYRVLVKPEVTTDGKQGLLKIAREFGDFAIQIWSHNYYVRYFALGNFCDRTFQVSAPDLEAARAVRWDGEDTSLDGRPIPVVLQPLIEGYGTPDGKSYDTGRIWSKAVVWVSNIASN